MHPGRGIRQSVRKWEEIYLYFVFQKNKKEKNALLIVKHRMVVKGMFENINMEEDENKKFS